MKNLIYTCLFFILFFTSCKDLKEVQCTGVKGFKVKSINTSGIEAEIILGIKNPNNTGFSIYKSNFDVTLSGIALGPAKLKRRVHVGGNSEQNYAFTLKSSFKDMNMMDVMKLVNSTSFGTVHVKGNLKVGKFFVKKKVPIDVKESLR